MDDISAFKGVELIEYASKNYVYMSFDAHLRLGGVKEETINKLLCCSYEIHLGKGSTFAPEFDSSAVCHLKQGLLRTDVELVGDRISNSSFILKEGLFVSPGPDALSNVMYQCLEESVITCIPADVIYRESMKDETLFRYLVRIFSEISMKQRDWALFSNVVGKREHIIFSLILMCVHSSLYGKDNFTARYQDLSDMSGTTVQYVLKVIHEAFGVGAIRKVYGGFEVLDLKLLCSMVDYRILNELISKLVLDHE
ncbi:hypothetical protein [Ferrimonas kyonanensis]|uniref:hypothetical protein n=1 Tax=Ferrimonas kyonanensis TaxID=364763 RepID=UPI0012EBE1CB|nr:hypothetical protein [Ferrimonas kyonanensis]